MPIPSTSQLPKPQSWEEFEDIVWDVYKGKWNDPHAQRYGRTGQAQQGVDVYGRPEELEGEYVGVQCKRYDRLKLETVEEEIAKAEQFKPDLAKFIIATTASRDSRLQEAIRLINQERERAGKFSVEVMFWEDLSHEISGSLELFDRYYGWLRHRPLLVPFQAPQPKSNFVPRPGVTKDLKKLLISEKPVGKDGPRVVAIHGFPGSGKSVMAAAVAHDTEVISHFSDGILWATLGQDPNVSEFLGGWIQALQDYDFRITGPEAALRHLSSLLSKKSVLIVIDDAWNPVHVTSLLAGGPHCAVLVTTRETVAAKAAGVTKDNLYELKVMEPEQCMALLAGGAGRTLPEAVSPFAREVAEAVGHLPLALELAAAQAAEDIPWDKLRDDLLLEIARLESLDDLSAEEIADPDTKKSVSLIGSLNLSLRRLSPPRLRQFAWFGVLPDDVAVTSAMAATLWATDGRSARDSLRYFQSKALLAAGELLRDGSPTHIIHDVLHVMAKRLLTGDPEPEGNHRLPGLGLELEAAHAQLVDRYRTKTQNGLWHTVPDDGYIHAHLVWHLDRAKLRDELYNLISKSWMDAKFARFGSHRSFASDVESMIVAAESEQPLNVVQLVRGSLIYATLGSLAAGVPAEALGVLAEVGQGVKARGYAWLIRDKSRQSEAYRLIGEALLARGEFEEAKDVLEQALAAAEAIKTAWNEPFTLSAVAQALAQAGEFDRALRAVETIADKRFKAKALGTLARALARAGKKDRAVEVANQALAAVEAISDARSKAEALSGVAQTLAEVGEFDRALAAVEAISDARSKAEALSGVARALVEAGEFDRALAAVETIGAERWEAEALSAVAQTLARMGERDRAIWMADGALLAVETIEDEWYAQWVRSEVALALAQAGEFDRALAAVETIGDERWEAEALNKVAQALTMAGEFDQALAVAEVIGHERSKAEALSAVAGGLAQAGEEAQGQQILSVAFTTARLAGRATVFKVMEQGASALAGIDQGQTLWRVHEELIAIEDWWGVGVQ